MNRTLKRAIDELSRLPDAEQEAYGRQLLDILEDERGWDERFEKTQDLLSRLSREAREEAARGDVLPYDPSDRPAGDHQAI